MYVHLDLKISQPLPASSKINFLEFVFAVCEISTVQGLEGSLGRRSFFDFISCTAPLVTIIYTAKQTPPSTNHTNNFSFLSSVVERGIAVKCKIS
jgi:hypothetical protein